MLYIVCKSKANNPLPKVEDWIEKSQVRAIKYVAIDFFSVLEYSRRQRIFRCHSLGGLCSTFLPRSLEATVLD